MAKEKNQPAKSGSKSTLICVVVAVVVALAGYYVGQYYGHRLPKAEESTSERTESAPLLDEEEIQARLEAAEAAEDAAQNAEESGETPAPVAESDGSME